MRILSFLLIPLAALFTGCSDDDALDTTLSTQQLSELEVADLQFLREEEKLAHDVYTYAFERFGVSIFSNIAASEQTHTDAVLDLMTAYQVEDSASQSMGVFNNAELAKLYSDLIAKVDRSVEDALIVGATIEDLDILDLDEKATHTDNVALQSLYSNLKCGSENHMRAFTRQLNNRALSYEPTYISLVQYQEILAATNGSCEN